MTEQTQDEKVVDLTGHQVELDDELFDTEATEVDLTNTRLRSVPIEQLLRVSAIQLALFLRINNSGLTTRVLVLISVVQKLVLRQNLLTDVAPLCALTGLTYLDLYDNRLEALPAELTQLTALQVLDLSFNHLRTGLEHVTALTALRELYLTANHLKHVPSHLFAHMPQLITLELGNNRLRTVAGLFTALTALQNLWLGRNKLSSLAEIAGDCALVHLKRLSVQQNRVTRLQGLAQLPNLEELYLSHNGITWSESNHVTTEDSSEHVTAEDSTLGGLAQLTALHTLDLASNHVTTLAGLQCMTALADLWLNDNQLEHVTALHTLTTLTHLDTLYIEGNPCMPRAHSAQHATHRARALWALGAVADQLSQLDATPLLHRDLSKLGK